MGVLYKLLHQLTDEIVRVIDEKRGYEKLYNQDRFSPEEEEKYLAARSELVASHASYFQSQKLLIIRTTLQDLLSAKDRQIRKLYYTLEVVSFVLNRHLEYYFVHYKPGFFNQSAPNFQQIRRLAAASKADKTQSPGKGDRNFMLNSSVNSTMSEQTKMPTFFHSYSEDKLAQIKDFQYETLAALPVRLLERILDLDNILSQFFFSMDNNEEIDYVPDRQTFLSINVKHIVRLLQITGHQFEKV